MQRSIVYGLLATFMLLTASLERGQKVSSPQDSKDIRISIIESEHGGYGYDIFVNEKISIHQPHIPAVHSLTGFLTKDDANKVAMTVVGKMRQNEMPPTVTLDDLIDLGVSQ